MILLKKNTRMFKESQSASPTSWAACSPADSPGAFSARLWILYACLILYATMWPFQIEWPPQSAWGRIVQGHSIVSWASLFADFRQNIMLFLPFGFLGYISLRAPKRFRKLACLGILLSVSIESIQILLWPRTPALVDVAANALGSICGAVIARIVSPYIRIFVLGLSQRLYRINFAIGVWILILIGFGAAIHGRADASIPVFSPMQNFIGFAVLSVLFSRWYAGSAFRWAAVRGPLSAVGLGFMLLTLEHIPAFPSRMALPIAGIWFASLAGGLFAFAGLARLPRRTLGAVFCGIVLILDRGLLRYHAGVHGPEVDQVWQFDVWMERFLMYFAFGFGAGWAFPKTFLGIIEIAAAGVLVGLLGQGLLNVFSVPVSGMAVTGLGAAAGAWVWNKGESAFAAYANRIRSMRKTVPR